MIDMKRFYHIVLLILLLTHFAVQAREYTVESVPNVQVAHRDRHVSDPENFLGNEAHNRINVMLSQLRDSNSVEAAVVVLPSIGNNDIDNFATELFTHWGIGKAANDNGLLIIAVMDQRQIVLRTGYGLEGVLPDITCSRIIRQYITPAFRDGNYGQGMTEAVEQILHIVMNPEASSELMADETQRGFHIDQSDKEILLNILYVYLALSVILSLLLTIRLNRTIRQYRNEPYECYKELNNSQTLLIITAIFFPLWCAFNLARCQRTMKQMREQPRDCPQCKATMERLSEEQDNHYLTPQEDAEERVGSVDYDVWKCSQCDNVEVFRFDNNTQYQECPHCHAKTYSLAHDRIVTQATTLSAGRGEKIYTCYYCKLRKVVPYIIPMIVVPKSGSGGGGGSFGGGFGGGMTGGGGARGGW